MATGRSLTFCRNWLLSPGSLGKWLRAGLVAYLHIRHRLPPAILLVRRGRRFTSLQSAATRADGLFGRLVHALATVDLGLAPAWGDLPAPALLTLPWALP